MVSRLDDLTQLIALVAEARAIALRLGGAGGSIVAQLEETLVEARALAATGGRADEGRRPEDLSSANDG